MQPRPMLCGKIDRAEHVVVPVHGIDAVEQRDPQPRFSVRAWKRSYMSVHALRPLPSLGSESPPLSSEPRK